MVSVYKPPEQRPEDEVAELLNRSLSSMDARLLAGVGEGEEEYQMIPALPPRPHIRRGPPLSLEQWQQALDDKGMVKDVDRVKQIIFRGVWRFI